MRIYNELDLNTFEAWSGAVSTLERIQREGKCEALEAILEELFPDGMDETELNDLLWFEPDTVFEWVGLRTETQINDEIQEKKDRLDEIEAELEEYANDEDVTPEELEEYKSDYEDEIAELKEEIEELEEELADL